MNEPDLGKGAPDIIQKFEQENQEIFVYDLNNVN